MLNINDLSPDQGIILGIGTILGGLIVRIVTNRQKNYELKYDEAQEIRVELREDLNRMQSKVEKISYDLDVWKNKYYALADENIMLRSRCRTLELEVSELRKKMASHTSSDAPLPNSDLDIQKQLLRAEAPVG